MRVNEDWHEEITQQFGEVLSQFPQVAFAYLYGSFLESETFRDIDVGIYVRTYESVTQSGGRQEAPGGLIRAAELADEITGALEVAIQFKYPIDLRLLNGAPVSFLYHVFKGKLIVCPDEELFAEILERAVQKYLDAFPLIHRAAKEAFAA